MAKILLVDTAKVHLPDIRSVRRDGQSAKDFGGWDRLLRDAAVSSSPSLTVTINATHSGTIVNRRCYPAKKMMAGLDSWVKPYPKPVLSDHPSPFGGDQLKTYGRVSRAEFVSLVKTQDALETDWMNPTVEDTGSGFARLRTVVTFDEAIEGILSGRLSTVSSGQKISHMYCSICGCDKIQDYLSGKETCEHMFGQSYEVESDRKIGRRAGKYLAYGITGVLEYDHVAFVSFPANPYASVVHSDQGLTDALCPGEPVVYDYYVSELVMTDSAGDILFDLNLDDKVVRAAVRSLPDDEEAREKSKNTPGLAEGKVLATVTVDSRISNDTSKPEEKRKMSIEASVLAESLVLIGVTDANKTFDWEGYTAKTGRDKSFLDLARGKDLSEIVGVSDQLEDAIIKGLTEDSYAGPDKTFPVVDQDTADACRRILRWTTGLDKASIDAQIELKLHPELTEDKANGSNFSEQDEAKDLEIKTLQDKNKALEEKCLALTNRIRRTLADQVCDSWVSLGRVESTADARRTCVDRLIARSIDSLENTLEDLRFEETLQQPKRTDSRVEDPSPTKAKPDKPPQKPAESKDPLLKAVGRN